MINVFSHDGGPGDLIYHLPAIGLFPNVYLYVYPSKRIEVPRISRALGESLCTLLCEQKYIKRAGYSENPMSIGKDMTYWRDLYVTGRRQNMTLTEMGCLYLNVKPPDPVTPWLQVPNPKKVARVVMNRCPRWHNPLFPWASVVEKYRDEAVFVGYPEEHYAFCRNFGVVPYHPTKDYLELAQVIAGCELYIGNQSSGAAIAEGLKKKMVQETLPRDHDYCNCVWERPGRTNGFDDTVALPDL